MASPPLRSGQVTEKGMKGEGRRLAIARSADVL